MHQPQQSPDGATGRRGVGQLHEELPRTQPTYIHTTGKPCSTAERRVPELIPVLGSQPVSHKPSARLPLLPAMPAVTLATLKRTATNFAAS